MAGYPPRSQTRHDFALDQQQGKAVSGVDLQAELANMSESINQIIGFIKAGFTSNRRWQPSSAKAQDLVEQYEYTATAGQTDFLFPTGTTADPVKDKARAFTNGSLIDPSSVTLQTDRVVLPPQTAGASVVTEIYNDANSLRTDLESTSAALGASLVGLEDVLQFFSGDNVEDVLAEIGAQLEAIKVSVVQQVAILADGSVPWEADQSVGGYSLKDLRDGVDPQDAVTVAQLDALTEIYGDLSKIFLALGGGTMSGPINMGNNWINSLKDGTEPKDAINKSQLDALEQRIADDYMLLAGGTFTGDVNMGGKKLDGLPTGDQGPSSAMRRDEIIAAVGGVSAAGAYIGGIGDGYTGSDDECPPCADDTFPDMTLEDRMHDLRGDIAWPADRLEIAHMVTIRVTGNLDLRNLDLVVKRARHVAQRPTEYPFGAYRRRGLQSGRDYEDGITNGPSLDIQPQALRRLNGRELIGGNSSYGFDDGAGFGGAGGAGGDGGWGENEAFEDDDLHGQGVGYTLDYPLGMWKHDVFPCGGDGAFDNGSSGSATARKAQAGTGGIRILVDGNIELEGASIDASSQIVSGNSCPPGGAGSIVIICKGNVNCGTGAVLRADGKKATDDDNSVDPGGSGGGYIAVVANRITGTLNISARGGDAFTNAHEAQGGYVEVSRAVVDDADVDPLIDVSKGNNANRAPQPTSRWNGFSRSVRHITDRLPFFGVQ